MVRFEGIAKRKSDLHPLHTNTVPTAYDQSSPGASDPARSPRDNSIRFYSVHYDAPALFDSKVAHYPPVLLARSGRF